MSAARAAAFAVHAVATAHGVGHAGYAAAYARVAAAEDVAPGDAATATARERA